jgi:hypothetical protein
LQIKESLIEIHGKKQWEIIILSFFMDQNAASLNNFGMGIGNLALQSTIIAAVMAKVKTGNALTDIILAGLISSLFTMLCSGLPTIVADVYNSVKTKCFMMYAKLSTTKEVTLKHVKIYNLKTGVNYNNSLNGQNNHLFDALEYYIQENQCILSPKSLQCNFLNTYADHGNDYKYMKSCSFKLSSCDPVVQLTNGITLYIDNQESQNDKTVTTTRIIRLCSNQSHEHVTTFLNTVYSCYVEKYYKKYDTSDEMRYFFTLKGEKDDSSSKILRWKKYELNSCRDFDSIFFPQKQQVIQLLNDFKNKQGMFARKCIPYKLAFCLSGVPGTGKTTFLKALSEYTKRHIFNISLPLIETNEQLVDIVHNAKIQTIYGSEGLSSETKIPLNKRIYVFEDVDVLSEIVNRRNNDDDFHVIKEEKPSQRDTCDICKKCKKFITHTENSSSDSSREDSDGSGEDSDSFDDDEICLCEKPIRRKNPALKKQSTLVAANLKKKKHKNSNIMLYSSSYERYCVQEDKLNLSGLLNVLDGLLELNEVIIVLTTNHPENLDPALIRHGRITHHMEMTYIAPEQIREMIKFHFPDINELDLDEIASYKFDKVTPAKIENMCIQCSDVKCIKSNLWDLANTIKI